MGRRRSPGVSLAAHPERSGGVGDKQAVAGEAGEAGEGGAGFQEGSCRLLSPLRVFERGRGAARGSPPRERRELGRGAVRLLGGWTTGALPHAGPVVRP